MATEKVADIPVDEAALVEHLRDPKRAQKAFDTMMRLYGERIYWHIRKLSTWLYKIAINESLNFIKKEKTRLGSDGTESDEALFAGLEADPWFDGDELQAELQRVIASLPEKQRLVFRMRYYDEMKYEEISEILGTSVGALKASYHHAVNKITKHFQL